MCAVTRRPTTSPSARRETGAALIWAILLMIVMSGLVVAFTMVASRAGERSGDASRRVANAATVQTAVTRVLYGFQNTLGSEQDFYTLDAADLRSIVNASGGEDQDVVTPPAPYRATYGIWEHDMVNGQHRLVPIAGQSIPVAAVAEHINPDPRACQAAGIPASSCANNPDFRAFWQVVRVVMPDTTGRDNPNVVINLRTWLGDVRRGSYSRASYARVEMRPGRFADFQLIADGNMHFGNGATIDGPVHSNGMSDGSFATVHTPPNIPAGLDSWIYLDNNVTCQGKASITITQGRVLGPGVARDCNAQGASGETISFLRAIDSLDFIQARNGTRGVHWMRAGGRRGDEARHHPYDTAWRVQLAGRTLRYWYPDGSGPYSSSLGRVNAYLFDEDVKVSGSVAADVRITVAARRPTGGTANIYVDGNITKGDPQSSNVGLIAQADIVLWQTMANPCRVTNIEAAMVASTGGLTIPTQYTTDELQDEVPTCTQRLRINGAIAGHRPPTLVWSWPGAAQPTGWTRRGYFWDSALQRNPPPFFPLTGTWQPFNVRDANVDCFYSPRNANPSCR
jgi:hypothetical protein